MDVALHTTGFELATIMRPIPVTASRRPSILGEAEQVLASAERMLAAWLAEGERIRAALWAHPPNVDAVPILDKIIDASDRRIRESEQERLRHLKEVRATEKDMRRTQSPALKEFLAQRDRATAVYDRHGLELVQMGEFLRALRARDDADGREVVATADSADDIERFFRKAAA